MEAVEAARNDPPLKIKQLFLAAIENVRSYHQKQCPESWLDKAEDGAQLGMQFNPINRVGLIFLAARLLIRQRLS